MQIRSVGHRLVSGLVATFALALVPALAGAATIVVDADGTYDAATTTCTGADPVSFTLIQPAVTASANGDTILVCPGTYLETQITINKALTVQSVAGAASTVIDGGGGTGLAFAGTVVINATAGNVLFDGFTVRNAKAGPSSVRFNVRVGSTAPVTITVTHNVLVGTDNPADGQDYGLYAAGPNANDALVFQHNQLLSHGSNTILIERHKGPTDVSFNTFTRGVRAGTISAYFNMSHTNDAITSLQKVSGNTIDMANDPGPYDATTSSNAIVFQGALTGTTLGSFSNVEISGNTITNLRGFRRGIVFSNGANTLANQALGAVSNAIVSCNSMTWSGPAEAGSQGIRLFGFHPTPTITNNTIANVAEGLKVEPRNGHVTNTATFAENSIAGTTVSAADWQGSGALDAEDNWWGAASGPTNGGNPGGTGGTVVTTTTVDFTPWLASGGDADPGACFEPGCGNGTADLNEDCDEGAQNGDPSACCSTSCTFRAAGESCRAAAGVCDVAETCTGAGGACPADLAETAGTECRASAGACDPAETCDGLSPACPADAVAGASVVCRASGGVCDPAETCDGVGVACPGDQLATAGTSCRASAGVCDLSEVCDGATPGCPADAKSTGPCRGAAGVCDVAESCDGVNDACPADAFAPASTVCRAASGSCDVAESCTGTSASCPADTGQADTDADTVCDAVDNCAVVANPGQENNDGDALGDACDPCTNLVPTVQAKAKLLLGKLLPPANDDKLSFSSYFTAVPGTPALDPIANGVRFVIVDSTGAFPVDVTIPGGSYVASDRAGWKVNGKGTAWSYKNAGSVVPTVNGINKVQIKGSSTAGRYKVKVKGKNGAYAVNTANLPLVATIVLDPPLANTGQCGEASFPSPTKPTCLVVSGGRTVRCK